MTGNQLLYACSMQDAGAEDGFCFGYIVGAIEGMLWGGASTFLNGNPGVFCHDELNALTSVLLDICLNSPEMLSLRFGCGSWRGR